MEVVERERCPAVSLALRAPVKLGSLLRRAPVKPGGFELKVCKSARPYCTRGLGICMSARSGTVVTSLLRVNYSDSSSSSPSSKMRATSVTTADPAFFVQSMHLSKHARTYRR